MAMLALFSHSFRFQNWKNQSILSTNWQIRPMFICSLSSAPNFPTDLEIVKCVFFYIKLAHFIVLKQAATKGTEKLIGDSLRANPSNLIANLGEVKPKLMIGHYAFSYVS